MKQDYYFLGFDQGIANSGIAVNKITIKNRKIIKKNIVYYKWVKTSSKDELQNRLVKIYNELNFVFKTYKLTGCACERLWKNDVNKGSGRNKSAGMMTANTSSAIIALLAGLNNTLFKMFVPSSVKKISTGSGTATKEDMIKSVLEDYQITDKLCEHIADAICISNAIGLFSLKENNLID